MGTVTPRTETLTGVDAKRIGDVVRRYHDEGATIVRTEKQPDGTFIVLATFGKGV